MNMLNFIIDLMAYSTFAAGITGALILQLLPEYKYSDIERDYDIHPGDYRMTIKAKSANGLTGVLIHLGDGQYRIRIYERFASSFQDYDINHSDLTFLIEDEDAYMYTDGNRHWIDHSPETLGIVNETQVEK